MLLIIMATIFLSILLLNEFGSCSRTLKDVIILFITPSKDIRRAVQTNNEEHIRHLTNCKTFINNIIYIIILYDKMLEITSRYPDLKTMSFLSTIKSAFFHQTETL